MGQKQVREDFERTYDRLIDKISIVKNDTIRLQKSINERDSTLVSELSRNIEEIIH